MKRIELPKKMEKIQKQDTKQLKIRMRQNMAEGTVSWIWEGSEARDIGR